MEISAGFRPSGSFIIDCFQKLVGHPFAARALREFIACKASGVGRGIGQPGSFEKGLARTAMVLEFVAKQNREASVEKGTFGIVFDAAIEVVACQLEILALVANAQRLAGL